jgi:hypothetical protein
MTNSSARSALGLSSLAAILVLGGCGSSAPANGGHAGSGGKAGGGAGDMTANGGAGGMTANGGAGGDACAGASGCPGPVGPDGATLMTSDVVLAVPAGALAMDEMITIQPTTAPAGYVLTSTAYEFLPAGTTFAKPVTVSITMPLPTPDAHLFWSNASGGFDDIGGTVNGNVITGQVTHFSIGFAAVPKKSDGGAPDAPMMSGDGGTTTDAGGAKDAASDAAAAGTSGAAGASGTGGAGGATAADGGAAGASSSDAGTSSDAAPGSDAGGGAGSSGGSDASAGIDAASLCMPFGLNAPVFQPTLVTDGGTAPAGATYTGGTIPSGMLYLNGVTHYGATYTGPTQEILIYDATAHTLRIADHIGNGMFYIGLENVTNTDAHTIVGDVVCNTLPNSPFQTRSWYYSVVGSKLTMSSVGSSDVNSYILPAVP